MLKWYIAGFLIGVTALLLNYLKGKNISASSTYSFIVDFFTKSYRKEKLWLFYFFIGMFFGGFISFMINGFKFIPHTIAGLDEIYGSNPVLKAIILFTSGLFIGFGTRMAGGCTSGHCIVGAGFLKLPSVVATLVFFLTAVATSFFIEFLLKQ